MWRGHAGSRKEAEAGTEVCWVQMRLWHAAGAHLGHLPSPEPSRCPWETLDQGAWLAGWAPCAFQPALATGFPTPEAPWWLSWPMSGVWRGGGGVAEQSSGEGSGGTHIIGNGELVGAGWGTGVQTWAHQGDSVRPVGGGHPGPCAPHPAQPQLLSKQRRKPKWKDVCLSAWARGGFPPSCCSASRSQGPSDAWRP